MRAPNERRREPRIHYSWPLWFGYENCRELCRGTVFDLSRSAVSFSVPADECPAPGEHLVTRFSYPCLMDEDFEMDTYYHYSEVMRVQSDRPGFCRVVLRLHQPLEHHPHVDVPSCVGAATGSVVPQEYAEAMA